MTFSMHVLTLNAQARHYELAGTGGVAGPGGVWLADVLAKGSGVQKCYEAVMVDQRCAKDYFSLG